MAGEWQRQGGDVDVHGDNVELALGSDGGADVSGNLELALGSDGGADGNDNLELALGSDGGADVNDNLELALGGDVNDTVDLVLGSDGDGDGGGGDVSENLDLTLGSDGGAVNGNVDLALGSDGGDVNGNLDLALTGDVNDNIELALGSDGGADVDDNLDLALGGDVSDNLDLALGSDGGDMNDNLHLSLGSDGSFELLWPQNEPATEANRTGTIASSSATTAAAAEEEDTCAASGFKRKRHSREQIQHLEAAYQECPHPDDNQRRDLSERLGLTLLQVKFWFQNRRSSNKNQIGREESRVLRDENDALRAENESIREAIIRKTCLTCGGPTVPNQQQTPEQRRLRLENARLEHELRRAAAFLATMTGDDQAAAVYSGDCYGGLPFSLNHHAAAVVAPRRLPVAVDFPGMRFPPPRALADPTLFAAEDCRSDRCAARGNAGRGALQRYVLRASDELRMLAGKGSPMWLPAQVDGEVLNGQAYADATYPGILGNCPAGYAVDGTRETGFVIGSGDDLVGVFTDAARWSEMFPDIVVNVTARSLAVPKPSRHGLIQLLDAEVRVLSPRLPLRRLKFIRHSQMLKSGVWMVVDVSVDGFSIRKEGSRGQDKYMASRMLPSGCLIEDMNNGYCKVTWIMIAEYDETAVLPLYHPLLRSGTALGARRWLASLQRQCEYLAVLASDPARTLTNTGGIPPEARNGVLELSRRMTASFHAAVSGPGGQAWSSLDEWGGGYGVGSERFDLAVRFVTSPAARGNAPGGALVLTATTTVWLPGVPPQCVFDYLCDGERRGEWDVLADGAPVVEEGYVATGQIHGNAVSVLRRCVSSSCDGGGDSSSKLILQEARIDAACMLLSYAPIAEQSMAEVMKGHGGASASAFLLPSGFVVLPDGHRETRAPPSAGASSSSSCSHKNNGGSLVSAAYQTLLVEPPPETVAAETIENVGNMLCRAMKKIKDAVHANIVVTA